MASAINNGNYLGGTWPKAPVESVYLYRPQGEHPWSYSHHPSIVKWGGRLGAMWSNGRFNEDDLGQRVLMSWSDDFATWSQPEVLMDAPMGMHTQVVLTASGFHAHGDTLNAYAGQYEYEPANVENGSFKKIGCHHINIGLWALTTKDGKTWSPPVDMAIPVVPNHGPQATRSGRLIISGNISFPYTDDPTGLSGWKMTGIYPESVSATIFDDSESHIPYGVCEGSFYQSDDGVLHMLLRTGEGVMKLTESRDDGTSWSAPETIAFHNNNTKFHCGRLPDGRFYIVGSPDPDGRRCPLVLSLSQDGVNFNEHFILADQPFSKRYAGLYKGGVYGYPHTCIADGYLYTICSICKEDIIALRVRLDSL